MKQDLILWGKHPKHCTVWIKLDCYTVGESKRRQKQGWQVAILPKGCHPDGQFPA